MQTLSLPEVGKTYRSTLYPEFVIYIDRVKDYGDPEPVDDSILISGRDAAPQKDGTYRTYDLIVSEWMEHGFILA